MRIAIMTWFHYINYGTALQVTALTKKLESYGHQVYVIGYYPTGRYLSLPSSSVYGEIFDKVVNKFKSRGKHNIVEKLCSDTFDTFKNIHLKMTENCASLSELEALNDNFDVFICGSDQIWCPLCFDSHYFLDFVKDPKKMIAYAPSIGTMKIEDSYIEQQIKKSTLRFKHISIREDSGSKIICDLTGKSVKTVLDPTLLLNRSDWLKLLNVQRDGNGHYLLVYFLGNNKKHWDITHQLANKLNLALKIIPVFEADLQREGGLGKGIGPAEFVSYVKNADYVCTDSFHGVAFSINFEKEFCCFERFTANDRENQNSRIYNILNKLDLHNRLYVPKSDTDLLTEKIVYTEVSKSLEDLRKKSLDFLLDALNEVREQNSDAPGENNHVFKNHTLCCGCGACSAVCPKSAICISKMANGFYEADINEELCVSCGKCNSVCPFQNKSNLRSLKEGALYSYKDIDESLLWQSSSGGFAFRVSKLLMEHGYSVAGCIFDREKQQARHILLNPGNVESLDMFQGSKYMQSEFSTVMRELRMCKTPIAMIGTPCQIAGARNLLKERGDVLYIDLICHGVPTYLLYEKYKDTMRNQYGMETDRMQIVFRYKPKGWRERYIYATDFDKEIVAHQSKDEYFLMFEQGACYSKACYECRWRSASSADLRIGDYWGTRFKNDVTGVSMILAITENGTSLLEKMGNSGYGKNLLNQPLEDYYDFQQTDNSPRPVFYDDVMDELQNETTKLTSIVTKYAAPFERREQVMSKVYEIYDRIKK